MDSDEQVVVSRGQLELLEERMAAGADPLSSARWIGRITDSPPAPGSGHCPCRRGQKNGYYEHLYAAADAAVAERRRQREAAAR
ncbi:MAG: hypothetical protein PHQ28_02980 [Mycobacterium sp.]|nr:hypothetical protein [Mycobacterium sp.]